MYTKVSVILDWKKQKQITACLSKPWFKATHEVATVLSSKVSKYCGWNPWSTCPSLGALVNSGLHHHKYFDVTAPIAERRNLSGLCPAFKEECAIVGRNEQVTFHWTCFICFPRLWIHKCKPCCEPRDSCRTDTSPISLTSYQHNFSHSTKIVLFQGSFRRVYVSTRVRSSGFCSSSVVL